MRITLPSAYAVAGGALVALALAYAIWAAFQPPAACGLQGGVAVPCDAGLGSVLVPGCGLVVGGILLVLGLVGIAAERDRMAHRRRSP